MPFIKSKFKNARGNRRVIFTQYIKNHFGSKRGWMRACLIYAARHLGCYRQFNKIDFARVERLVFICNGNICRSPLGEAVARAHGVEAISYGLDTRGGDNADPRAIAFGHNNKFLLGQHKTRKIKEYCPSANDLLVGMEPKHSAQLVALYGDKVQITLAGLWLTRPRAYLHDPYNTNSVFFNHCEDLVVQAASSLAQRVKKQA